VIGGYGSCRRCGSQTDGSHNSTTPTAPTAHVTQKSRFGSGGGSVLLS
jgi:hypothetical protein